MLIGHPYAQLAGGSRIVAFGGTALRLDNSLIVHLQQRTAVPVKPALEVGDSVLNTEGGFAEVKAIFVAMDGEQRVLLLLNMLNRQRQISMPLVSIVKN
jgi:transcriptional antiterminator RfaH